VISASGLLTKKRFLPFFICQFLGAFNDNLFKNAIILMIAFPALALGQDEQNTLITAAAGLFILPFVLFSGIAGKITDNVEKSQIMRRVKALEIFIMLLACFAFYNQSIYMAMALLFLMGTQSAFFGPAKYAILPQHLKTNELVLGNGMVQTGTFIAILIGTMTAGILISIFESPIPVGIVLAILSIFGYLASRHIPVALAATPNQRFKIRPVTDTLRLLKVAAHKKDVFWAILAISWFWAFGSVYLTQIAGFTKFELNSTVDVITLMLTLFSLGIGIGSMLCHKATYGYIELGLLPIGALGLTYFGIDLYQNVPSVVPVSPVTLADFFTETYAPIITDILMIGVCGGFYIVPLQSYIQKHTAPAFRASVIGANNVFNALFMVVASLISGVILGAGFSISELLLFLSLANILVFLAMLGSLPNYFFRLSFNLLFRALYRLEVHNKHLLPSKGPSIVAANHISFTDPLLLASITPVPARFVMDHFYYRLPILNWFFKIAKAIPIAPGKEDPRVLAKAWGRISQALNEQAIVAIFPEGGISYSGDIEPFKPGIEKIILRNPTPVVPVALCGLWGSIFSRKNGGAFKSRPWPLRRQVDIFIGQPIPPDQFSLDKLESAIRKLHEKSNP